MITQTQKTAKMRPAFGLLEIGLVLLLVGGIAIAALSSFGKKHAQSQADTEFQKVSDVLTGLETTKKYNNGVYPIGAAANLDTITVLVNAMGGPTKTQDVASWKYNCAAGSNQTVTLTTTSYEDPTVQTLVLNQVNSNSTPWTATAAGSTIVITKTNTTCQ
ncbi:MAG: hypothetical protein IE916_00290 [Epsilonproteobacteria bacterium]|nr:hypothetical protein [Campylobacterota bacterium]